MLESRARGRNAARNCIRSDEELDMGPKKKTQTTEGFTTEEKAAM
jgi:hypothetical protein